jgi:hypothetical protein
VQNFTVISFDALTRFETTLNVSQPKHPGSSEIGERMVHAIHQEQFPIRGRLIYDTLDSIDHPREVSISRERRRFSTSIGLAKNTILRLGFGEMEDIQRLHHVCVQTESGHSNCTAMVTYIARSAWGGCVKRETKSVNTVLVQDRTLRFWNCSD